jgi:cell pole-organizing protein PopZ
MTQPAKVQEPSMEEILASIRRIIADDEAKPAEKPAGAAAPAGSAATTAAPPAGKPAVMTDIVAAAQPTPAKAPEPPPAAGNSQDDIDAMLAGLDAATSEAEVRPPLPDGEVFDLTDEMVLSDPQPAPFRKVEPHDDLEFNETVAASAPPRAQHRRPAFEPPPLYESPAPPPPQILSHSTVSAVESAFNTLANTVLSNNARTLEDLVREMLRPMLKSWLDDNLPGLVERIVKAEIERVSRGR